MKILIEKYLQFTLYLQSLNNVVLLIIRLVLAYGFYEPAINKWNDIKAIAVWFHDMGLPLPLVQAYAATYTEVLGVILLVVGACTRMISFSLIILLCVAIKTVHLSNGFAASENGYEIPLYYIIMLLVLLVNGGGKLSIDNYLKPKLQ
jgi:putative oxidoreductase